MGKKYIKNPRPFTLPDDEDFGNELSANDSDLAGLMEGILTKNDSTAPAAPSHTRLQIRVIHAIDMKQALDDLAENEGVGFDTILDVIEHLVGQGKKLDINYFTNEVVGFEYVQELLSYYAQASNDNLDSAIREYGDVYNPQELRLARIVHRVNKLKRK